MALCNSCLMSVFNINSLISPKKFTQDDTRSVFWWLSSLFLWQIYPEALCNHTVQDEAGEAGDGWP